MKKILLNHNFRIFTYLFTTVAYKSLTFSLELVVLCFKLPNHALFTQKCTFSN